MISFCSTTPGSTIQYLSTCCPVAPSVWRVVLLMMLADTQLSQVGSDVSVCRFTICGGCSSNDTASRSPSGLWKFCVGDTSARTLTLPLVNRYTSYSRCGLRPPGARLGVLGGNGVMPDSVRPRSG